MQDFTKLAVWDKSHALTLKIYEVTSAYPSQERFGLISQMQRSSSSVPTNIAEGCGRDSQAELKRFLIIAMGSASELHYQLILSRDLNYLSIEQYTSLEKQVIEVKKMLAGFIRSINRTKN